MYFFTVFMCMLLICVYVVGLFQWILMHFTITMYRLTCCKAPKLDVVLYEIKLIIVIIHRG